MPRLVAWRHVGEQHVSQTIHPSLSVNRQPKGHCREGYHQTRRQQPQRTVRASRATSPPAGDRVTRTAMASCTVERNGNSAHRWGGELPPGSVNVIGAITRKLPFATAPATQTRFAGTLHGPRRSRQHDSVKPSACCEASRLQGTRRSMFFVRARASAHTVFPPHALCHQEPSETEPRRVVMPKVYQPWTPCHIKHTLTN